MSLHTKPLIEYATFYSGGTPSKSVAKYWAGDIPWLTPKDMSQFDGSTQDCVSEEAIGNGTRLAPRGSLFIAVRGMSLHNEIRVVRPEIQMSFNQDIKAITPNDSVDGRFLYYALKAWIPELLEAVEAAGHGTGVLPTDRLANVPIPVFAFTEQCTIATLLGALDDKIELNRRMNETLEEMARALFRDWFVDFGPTRAKVEGREPYLAEHIWNLFPDRLDPSSIRPKGWTQVSIRECCTSIISGGTPATKEASFWDGDIPWLSSGETRALIVEDTERKISQAGVDGSSTRWARSGSTAIASAGQGNTRGQASMLARGMYINQSVIVAEANRERVGDLQLFLDISRRYDELRQISDSNSSRGSLTTKMVADLSTTLAPQTVTSAFEGVAAPLFDKVIRNERASRTLAETRDYLLPKLMSGEIRVRDAEKMIEDAA